MPGFSVNIGADTAQLAQGLSKAQADILQFANAIVINSNNAAGALASIPAALRPINPAQMQSLTAAVQRLKQDIGSFPKNIPDPFNNVQKGANQAMAALTNVGRVAQDLPFGFVGIQNNLNPLLESFQRLKAETGSSSAALKALGSSLIGPGGIGLALSVVSAAILIYQNGIAGFTTKTKAAKDEAQKLAELLKSVKSATDTAFEGVGASQAQIIQVQALATAVGDETKSQVERGRALEKLKSINKEYFGDLKLQEDSLKQLTPLVNEYTNAIIQQAIIGELSSEIGKIGATFVKQKEAVRQAKDALDNYKQSLNIPAIDKAGNRVFVLDDNIDALNLNLKKAQETLAPTAAKFNDLSNSLKNATTESLKFKLTKDSKTSDGLDKQLSLLEKIRDAQKEFTGKMFDLKNIDEATDKLAKLEQQVGDLKLQIAVRDAKKAGLPAGEIEKLKDAIKQDTEKRLNEAFEKEALLLEFSTKLKFSPVNKAEIPANIDSQIAKATGFDKRIPEITLHEARVRILGAKLTEKIEFREKITKELNDALNEAVKNLKIDAVSGIADALGEALSGGDIKNVFKSLFNVIASGLQQFGKALISYGLAQKAFQIATKSLNPALAIAAGAGLIIAGAALRASLPKFATGGIVTGPLIGQIGEMHRPEVIMPLDRLPQMLRSIGGGGGNDLQFIPIINNEGLYLAVQRGARRVGRKF